MIPHLPWGTVRGRSLQHPARVRGVPAPRRLNPQTGRRGAPNHRRLCQDSLLRVGIVYDFSGVQRVPTPCGKFLLWLRGLFLRGLRGWRVSAGLAIAQEQWMKTSSIHTLAALAISSLFLVGSPPSAHAAAFSAGLDINTTTEFSGHFSVRVGYSDPAIGKDEGGSLILTGQIPGSIFRLNAGNPHNSAGAYLNDTALDAEYGALGFSGTWYGEVQYSDTYYVSEEFEYRLEADWSRGGMLPGFEPEHDWIDDFVWGYWSGTFSIKKLRTALPDPPTRVPDSGGTLAIFAGALGLLGGLRRLLSSRVD